jgi:NADH-quinone oxidoreductase subunit H
MLRNCRDCEESATGKMTSKGVCTSPVNDFYLTNPIARASQGDGRVFGLGLRPPRPWRRSKGGTPWTVSSQLCLARGHHLAQSLAGAGGLLMFIAYILYADRKIWAAVQLRRGPNVVGPWGLFQSFADLLKFVFKEPVIPIGCQQGRVPARTAGDGDAGAGAWAVIPVNAGWVIADINVGILFLFAISSLGVYGVIMGGWASNSKYPFLGALRSAAQMVSYEVSIGFVIVTVLMCVGSLNLSGIVMAQADRHRHRMACRTRSFLDWHWLPLFPMFIIFFISALAETNRPPFDLPEAESELVAGFMVEYGSTPYMMFMLGEYVRSR